MRGWFFIIFGLSFLLASSIMSGKFTPRSSRERAIAIVFIILLVLIVGWAIWQLLPYYSQPGEVRVSQAPSIPAYTPQRSAPVSKSAPQETGRYTATPVRNPQVVTITRPVSIAVQYGSVSVSAGAKLPFVSRAGDKVRVRYYDGADYDIPM